MWGYDDVIIGASKNAPYLHERNRDFGFGTGTKHLIITLVSPESGKKLNKTSDLSGPLLCLPPEVLPIHPRQSGEDSLARNLAEHLHSGGGVPLINVLDRPKTVALKWRRNGEVTEWSPVFAYGKKRNGG